MLKEELDCLIILSFTLQHIYISTFMLEGTKLEVEDV